MATTYGVGEVAPILCVHATASLPSNFGRMIKSTMVPCRAAKCFRACTSQPGKPSREQALEARIAELEAKLAKKDEVIAKKDAVIAKKDEVIAKKDAVIAKKDAVIAKKDEVIAKKDAVIAEISGEYVNLKKSRWGNLSGQWVPHDKQAIAWYLRHRSSLQLSVQASGFLEQLRLLVAKMEPLSDQEREGLFDLFGQCRFGFQEALNASGDNEQARDGLQNTFELMIRYEIEQKSVHAAEMLLAQLPSPNEELQRQLERLKRILAEKEQEIARLQKLHYDKDQTVGAGTRFYFALLFGGGWG